MQDMKTFALVTFLIYFGLLVLGISLSFMLFRKLKKSHVTYYESVGEPLALAPINPTEGSFIQLLRGNVFLLRLVFKGIPKKFPKDLGLRKLAWVLRIVFAAVIVLFILLVILGYFLYESGLIEFSRRV